MAGCAQFEEHLLERATGLLEGARAAELEAHLATCAACRAEAEANASVMEMAKLPVPSAAELAALDQVENTTRAALRKAERRDRWGRGISLAVLSAAAALLLVVSPNVFKHRGVNNLGVKNVPVTVAPVADPEDEDGLIGDSAGEDSDDADLVDASNDVDPDVDLPLSD